MTILSICTYPDPILGEPCAEVTEFNTELGTLLDNMAETMYDAQGIGLAAPQIGILKQITVIDITGTGREKYELINPRIVRAEGKTSSEEGCLSIPGYRDTVKRSSGILVEAQDRHGNPYEIEGTDLLAICMQHEIDHLHGTLFIDRLSRLKRELFKRWLKKQTAL